MNESGPQGPSNGGKTNLWLRGGRLRPGWEFAAFIPIAAASVGVFFFGVTALFAKIVFAIYPRDNPPLTWLLALFRFVQEGSKIAVVLIAAWVWLKWVCKRSFAEFGLGLNRKGFADFGAGALAGIAVMAAIFAVEAAAGWIEIDGFAWNFLSADRLFLNAFAAIMSMLAVAVYEEVIFRGWLLQGLERWAGLPVGVAVPSVFFGLMHLMNPAGGWSVYVVPFSLALAGLMFAAAYLWRRSLWVAIGLHFAWNLFEYDVLALTGSEPEYSSFLVTGITGPAFWVGLPNSSFGPEVGALGILGMAAVIAFFFAAGRRRKIRESRENVNQRSEGT